ncbi:MAG: hypothetical protein ACOH13_00560 [Flavobacteriales bacterium]
MDYRSFLQREIPKQNDPGVRAAGKIILNLEDLPASSDPRVLAKALHKLLDHQATKGFQVSMMFYNQLEPDNELPEELKKDPAKFLAAINAITELQDLSRHSGNNDPDHRWPSPLHQERFGKRK